MTAAEADDVALTAALDEFASGERKWVTAVPDLQEISNSYLCCSPQLGKYWWQLLPPLRVTLTHT